MAKSAPAASGNVKRPIGLKQKSPKDSKYTIVVKHYGNVLSPGWRRLPKDERPGRCARGGHGMQGAHEVRCVARYAWYHRSGLGQVHGASGASGKKIFFSKT